MLRGLYGLTDTKLTPYNTVLAQAKEALKGGMRILQLRDKEKSIDELLDIAIALKELCREHGAIFIIDDSLELALRCGADGLHIGKDDIGLVEARRALGDKIIGVSCYGDIDRAQELERLGASYVAFGSFFRSPTKPNSQVVSADILKTAKERLQIPVCAIGGITLENCKPLIEAGVNMVAVISDLWGSLDICEKSKAYSRLF